MRTLLCVFIGAAALTAQQPPKPHTPSDSELRQIQAKTAELGTMLKAVESHPLYADAAIYHKAAEFILRIPGEFYTAAYVKDTLNGLETGIARAKELAAGTSSWTTRKGRVLRAYRSKIDGSIQPYGLIIPESYNGQPFRLDIWM